MDKPTIEQVQEKYIEDRDEIARLNKKIEAIKVFQRAREDWIGKELAAMGAKTISTTIGTSFFKKMETVRVDNFEAVLDYVRENNKWEILTKGVSKSEILHLMGDKREETPPPGVSYTSFNTVQVRRA